MSRILRSGDPFVKTVEPGRHRRRMRLARSTEVRWLLHRRSRRSSSRRTCRPGSLDPSRRRSRSVASWSPARAAASWWTRACRAPRVRSRRRWAGIGATWSDVTDIVVTHAHFDHVGGLADVVARSTRATLWAGALDVAAVSVDDGIVIRPLVEGDRVGGLDVLETPGHTPGHISLLHEAGSLVFVGDLVGTVDGELTFGPPAFTADAGRSRTSLERVAGLAVDRLLFSHGPEVSDPNARVLALLGSSS